MNRFLIWDHKTLAQLAQDLWDQNQALRRSLQLCTCAAGGVGSSMPQVTGESVQTVQRSDES